MLSGDGMIFAGKSKGRNLLLLIITLVLPWVAVIVIPASFPESRLINFDEANIGNVFGTFPIVQMRDYHAYRSSISKRNGLSVNLRSKKGGV
jgi:hypothetical protein